jgi:hypothetical protein
MSVRRESVIDVFLRFLFDMGASLTYWTLPVGRYPVPVLCVNEFLRNAPNFYRQGEIGSELLRLAQLQGETRRVWCRHAPPYC